MASRTIVTLQDDIDGGEAVESFTFAFEGKSYAIDLSEKNAAKFRKAIAPFVGAARREGAARRTGQTKAVGRSDIAEIRAWAQQNGYVISTRGRIAREIQEAYDTAQ